MHLPTIRCSLRYTPEQGGTPPPSNPEFWGQLLRSTYIFPSLLLLRRQGPVPPPLPPLKWMFFSFPTSALCAVVHGRFRSYCASSFWWIRSTSDISCDLEPQTRGTTHEATVPCTSRRADLWHFLSIFSPLFFCLPFSQRRLVVQ